jgi:D-alanyl-D-alanine carboxypeptidase/D-alanyl-D-alanine-endopeptidase (penicillin-binding protein 4)
MKRYFAALALALFAVLSPDQSAFAQRDQPVAKTPDTVAALQKRIDDLINNRRYAAALWGVKIFSLDSGKTLYEHDAGKLFSPASNSKLYTMALALDRLGPDYRIKTSLYAQARPDVHGVIAGDLIIYGRGDPTINARLHDGNIFKALEPLVAALTNAGVKQISGDLIGDDSFFRGPPFGSSWHWEDFQEYYGAEVSALTINDNTLQLLVRPGDHVGAPCSMAFIPPTTYVAVSNRTQTAAKGARHRLEFYRPVGENVLYVSGNLPIDDHGSTNDVTMHNPAGLFAQLFRTALADKGIVVSGKTRTMNWKDREAAPLVLKDWIELGSMDSLPMRDIIREVQKPSQNLYTDLMLAHVGATTPPATDADANLTAEDAGLQELAKFLAKAGIKRGETIFDEGSGLSRDNLTTPNATITLLTFMSRHKDAQIYLDALPIAGVDGTLRRRMKGTVAEGKIHAKTGTLRWANSMSGYVTTAAGERLVFSLMLNRYQSAEPGRSKTADLDAIGIMLAGFTGRSDKPAN